MLLDRKFNKNSEIVLKTVFFLFQVGFYQRFCLWLSFQTMAAFVLTLHGASRAFLTSQWRNLTLGQITVLPNYVIVTSKTLCSKSLILFCNAYLELVEMYCSSYRANQCSFLLRHLRVDSKVMFFF